MDLVVGRGGGRGTEVALSEASSEGQSVRALFGAKEIGGGAPLYRRKS